MPVPTSLSDLSTTAASNYPQGTDSPSTLDDVQRAHASFIAQIDTGANLSGKTSKTTPVDADLIPLSDSAAGNILKKLTWANLKATLSGSSLPIGSTTPSTGAFTSLSTSSTATFGGPLLTNGPLAAHQTSYAVVGFSGGDTSLRSYGAASTYGTVTVMVAQGGSAPISVGSFSSTGLAVTGLTSVTATADQNQLSIRRVGATSNPGMDMFANETGNTVGWNTAYSLASPDYVWKVGGSEIMRLMPSGNLGLGVTPQTWNSSYKALSIMDSTGMSLFSSSYTASVAANLYINASSQFVRTGATYGSSYYIQFDGRHRWYGNAAGAAGVFTPTQNMELDASGNLLVGTTTSTGRVAIQVATNGDPGIYFRNQSGTNVGQVQVNSSTTAYVTSSDKDLKTDLGIATDTSVIDNTEIHDFSWKIDGTVDRGVFAQDAYLVKPNAVRVGSNEVNEDGSKDNPWGVDYSKYVPDLIVYAKNLKSRVAQLEADKATLLTVLASVDDRLAALEAK